MASHIFVIIQDTGHPLSISCRPLKILAPFTEKEGLGQGENTDPNATERKINNI